MKELSLENRIIKFMSKLLGYGRIKSITKICEKDDIIILNLIDCDSYEIKLSDVMRHVNEIDNINKQYDNPNFQYTSVINILLDDIMPKTGYVVSENYRLFFNRLISVCREKQMLLHIIAPDNANCINLFRNIGSLDLLKINIREISIKISTFSESIEEVLEPGDVLNIHDEYLISEEKIEKYQMERMKLKLFLPDTFISYHIKDDIENNNSEKTLAGIEKLITISKNPVVTEIILDQYIELVFKNRVSVDNQTKFIFMETPYDYKLMINDDAPTMLTIDNKFSSEKNSIVIRVDYATADLTLLIDLIDNMQSVSMPVEMIMVDNEIGLNIERTFEYNGENLTLNYVDFSNLLRVHLINIAQDLYRNGSKNEDPDIAIQNTILRKNIIDFNINSVYDRYVLVLDITNDRLVVDEASKNLDYLKLAPMSIDEISKMNSDLFLTQDSDDNYYVIPYNKDSQETHEPRFTFETSMRVFNKYMEAMTRNEELDYNVNQVLNSDVEYTNTMNILVSDFLNEDYRIFFNKLVSFCKQNKTCINFIDSKESNHITLFSYLRIEGFDLFDISDVAIKLTMFDKDISEVLNKGDILHVHNLDLISDKSLSDYKLRLLLPNEFTKFSIKDDIVFNSSEQTLPIIKALEDISSNDSVDEIILDSYTEIAIKKYLPESNKIKFISIPYNDMLIDRITVEIWSVSESNENKSILLIVDYETVDMNLLIKLIENLQMIGIPIDLLIQDKETIGSNFTREFNYHKDLLKLNYNQFGHLFRLSLPDTNVNYHFNDNFGDSITDERQYNISRNMRDFRISKLVETYKLVFNLSEEKLYGEMTNDYFKLVPSTLEETYEIDKNDIFFKNECENYFMIPYNTDTTQKMFSSETLVKMLNQYMDTVLDNEMNLFSNEEVMHINESVEYCNEVCVLIENLRNESGKLFFNRVTSWARKTRTRLNFIAKSDTNCSRVFRHFIMSDTLQFNTEDVNMTFVTFNNGIEEVINFGDTLYVNNSELLTEEIIAKYNLDIADLKLFLPTTFIEYNIKHDIINNNSEQTKGNIRKIEKIIANPLVTEIFIDGYMKIIFSKYLENTDKVTFINTNYETELLASKDITSHTANGSSELIKNSVGIVINFKTTNFDALTQLIESLQSISVPVEIIISDKYVSPQCKMKVRFHGEDFEMEYKYAFSELLKVPIVNKFYDVYSYLTTRDILCQNIIDFNLDRTLSKYILLFDLTEPRMKFNDAYNNITYLKLKEATAEEIMNAEELDDLEIDLEDNYVVVPFDKENEDEMVSFDSTLKLLNKYVAIIDKEVDSDGNSQKIKNVFAETVTDFYN